MVKLEAAKRLTAYDRQWSDKAQKKIDYKYGNRPEPADADEQIFKQQPSALARSLKNRYKDDFKAAMGSLTYYINRAGKNFKSTDKDRLQKAKDELRKLYGKDKDEPANSSGPKVIGLPKS